MQITVIFFGRLKQDAGTRTATLDLPRESVTMDELSQLLAAQYPALVPHLPTLAYAVNDHLVDPAYVLHHGDEAALLPPVSGG